MWTGTGPHYTRARPLGRQQKSRRRVRYNQRRMKWLLGARCCASRCSSRRGLQPAHAADVADCQRTDRHHARTTRGRFCRRAAVAIDGDSTSSASMRPTSIAGRYRAARRSTRAIRLVLPGLDQHAHPRADGDVSRAGRRPRADGLAAEIHLPGGSQDGVAGDRSASARGWRRSR